jgi:hypothetical protein
MQVFRVAHLRYVAAAPSQAELSKYEMVLVADVRKPVAMFGYK